MADTRHWLEELGLARYADAFEEHEVESFLLRSLKITESHKQRMWGIRTVLSLAKFWMEGQERHKAHDILHSFFSEQSEGFDRPNMVEAKALLKQLQ